MSIPRDILFVCSGNICRSPLAEGLLYNYIVNSEVFKDMPFRIHSAGTLPLEPSPASEYSQIVANEYGADISAHVSRQIEEKIAEEADLIVVMARKHQEYIDLHFENVITKTHFLSEFLPKGDLSSDGGNNIENCEDIPDPIGYDLDYYREIGEKIDFHVRGLLRYLEKGQ